MEQTLGFGRGNEKEKGGEREKQWDQHISLHTLHWGRLLTSSEPVFLVCCPGSVSALYESCMRCRSNAKECSCQFGHFFRLAFCGL